eukprot:6648462-Pyramimonas_sp.AAC.1
MPRAEHCEAVSADIIRYPRADAHALVHRHCPEAFLGAPIAAGMSRGAPKAHAQKTSAVLLGSA